MTAAPAPATATTDRPILVLHDVGTEEGGSPWRAALAAEGWAGPVHAPDLPGHAGAAAPIGGNYELSDAVFAVVPLLRELAGGPAPVVVGVGVNGWAAQLLAVGRRASALVLVDGIGGPWLDAAGVIGAGRDLLRAIADDPDALAPPPADRTDPRLAHGVTRPASRAMAERLFAALSVPVLALETPASPLVPDDRRELLARSSAAVTVVEVADGRPDTIVPHIVGSYSSFLSQLKVCPSG